MLTQKLRIAVATVTFVVAADAARADVIDDFSAGTITVAPSDAFFAEQQTGLSSGSLTGYRQLAGFNGLATSRAGIVVEVDPVAPGSISITTSPTGSASGEVNIWFTGSNEVSNPLDLTASGNSAFVIDVIEADFANAGSFTFDFVVGSGLQPQGGVSVPVTLGSSTTPYSVVVPFSDWVFQGKPLDFSNVTRIVFGNDQFGSTPLPAGTTLRIDSFRTVPEPASLVVLLTGLALLLRRGSDGGLTPALCKPGCQG